jgi:gas vesicle protein
LQRILYDNLKINTDMSNLFRGAALFIGGALVGAAAALLLTPKTGEEVRKDLADLAGEAKKQAQDYCEQVKKEVAKAEAAVEAVTAQIQEPQQPKPHKRRKKEA